MQKREGNISTLITEIKAMWGIVLSTSTEGTYLAMITYKLCK